MYFFEVILHFSVSIPIGWPLLDLCGPKYVGRHQGRHVWRDWVWPPYYPGQVLLTGGSGRGRRITDPKCLVRGQAGWRTTSVWSSIDWVEWVSSSLVGLIAGVSSRSHTVFWLPRHPRFKFVTVAVVILYCLIRF